MSYYDSIDEISMYNWRKCISGDKRYTRINIEIGDEKQDLDAWKRIYDTYLSLFGLSKQYKEYLSKQSAYIRALKKYAISGDDFDKNDVNVLRAELDKMERDFSGDGSSSLDDVIVYVSKWLGGGFIDEKKTTVRQFYTAYNKMIEHGKEN